MLRRLLSLVCVLCAAATFAAVPPDPQTTTIPSYVLPASAAADGNLGEWAGIPAYGPETFRWINKNETITPSDNFAPTLRVGMKPGSPDLYFLILVKDANCYTEDARGWLAGDMLEFFIDFGREARDKEFPDWQRNEGKWHAPRTMGQFGLQARTLQGPQRLLTATNAGKWTYDYAGVPVQGGGLAYELRIDGASVWKDQNLTAWPGYIGLNLGLSDWDFLLPLSTAGWNNTNGDYRMFGNGMDHAFTTRYGMVSLKPVAPPQTLRTRVWDAVPQSLPARFGQNPKVDDVRKALAGDPSTLADLVYWAGCQGVVFDAKLAKMLLAHPDARVRDMTLTVLYWTDQGAEVVKAALAVADARPAADDTPTILTAGNLLHEMYAFGDKARLLGLVGHANLTVAVSAARALARFGARADISALETATTAAIAARTGAEATAARVFLTAAVDTLKSRTEPITLPTCTPVRTVEKANTDLPRFMPVDGNNVYNAAGLLRMWPKEGPRELWRVLVGQGKSAVVVADGRAYTIAVADGKQVAICLDARTGETRWRHPLGPRPGRDFGPTASPVVTKYGVVFVPAPCGKETVPQCLAVDDGHEIWRGDPAYPAAEFSTPLAFLDTLYYGVADARNPVVAVSLADGSRRWTAPAGRGGANCASFCAQTIDNMSQVIIGVGSGDNGEYWGLDALTGELLWRYPSTSGYGPISSPVAVDSRVFLCDGMAPFSACLQMYVRDGKIRARQAYRSERYQRNMYNTVAVWNGAVFGFNSRALECTNFDDGKLLWRQEGKDWNAEQCCIVADGLLFATTTGGDIVLAEAGRTGFKELGRLSPNAELGYRQNLSLANGYLYLRSDKFVICYDLVHKP
jgi:outer membrane protein assembly factor BamB